MADESTPDDDTDVITTALPVPRLTPMQALFVEEYLVDLNAKQAAIRAGYSARTAHQQGSQIFNRPAVQAALRERMAARVARTEVQQDQVIRELARIAFGDLRDAVRWGPEGVTLRDSAGLAEDVARTIAEVKQSDSGLSIKRHDKLKALELLAKHLGMLTERQELKHDLTVHVEYVEEDDAR